MVSSLRTSWLSSGGSNIVEPRSDLALAFLQKYRPEGPWILTAIAPTRASIETRTFTAAEADACLAWLKINNGQRNLYFHVNPTLRPISKKAEREDIAELAWLHVDIDPRPGEDIAKEQERSLGLLRNPPKNVPPPTVIIFSGGGYQGFWRLSPTFKVNGELSLAEEAKRWNLQLEIIFGADHCHNIDRIMRLPGSINIPDAKKLKKGRKPILAELVEFHEDRLYPLSSFTPAAILQSAEDGGGRPLKVKISGNLDRVELDNLPERVTDRIKMIIVQGTDPDSPKKGDNSRSAWLFDVICQLVRAGLDDDTIFSIITDRDFGISTSVLDKPRPESYAIRQIERAREESIHPVLRELNDKHCVIADIGGKCRVIQELYDAALKRTRISKQTFDDFRNRYMHRKVELGLDSKGNPMRMEVGKWWLNHEMRRQYDTLVFLPGQIVENAYNLWKGFACEALPGDWSLFKNHIKDNVCGGNEEHFQYLMRWMASAVQHPDRPGEVAVVMRGKMGTGKGFFAREFGRIWGRHFMQVTDPKHLVGNFNAHLRDVVMLFADEAFYAGDNRHASILKGLITEETISIEAKGIDVENSMNYIHLIMSSNADWVVPAGLEERRFFALDVKDTQMQKEDYFGAIRQQLDEGGRSAMLHELLNINLEDFRLRTVPQTQALKEQKQFSMSLELQWWQEKLEEGRLLQNHGDWEKDVQKRMLQNDYVDFCIRAGVLRRQSPVLLGKFLTKVCPAGFPIPHQAVADVSVMGHMGEELHKRQRTYFYRMPSLGECRAWFDRHFGGPYVWPVEDSVVATPQQNPQQLEAPY